MTPLCRRFATTAVAFAVTLMGLSLPAHAGLWVELSAPGASATITDAGSTAFTGTAPSTSVGPPTPGQASYLPTGGFAGVQIVSLTVTSNYPGSTGLGGSNVQDIQLDVNNTSSSAVTLTLRVVSDGFTIPPSGTTALLTSTLSNNSTTGATSTFQSFIGNATPGVISASTDPGFTSTATPGLQPPNGLPASAPPLGGVATNIATLSVIIPGPGANGWALSNTMVVNLAAHSSDLVTGLTAVTVPEPSTMVTALASVGLCLVGSAFRFGRRRRVQA